MNNIVDRIDAVYKYLLRNGLISKKKDIAEKMRYNYPNTISALKGDRKYLTDSFVNELNIAFGSIFNKRWILEGNGQMLNTVSDAAIPIEYETVSHPDRDHMQPILDIRVCAGNGIGLEGDENKITEWVSIPSFSGCMGVTVYGDSMYDKYKSGDVIFVRPIIGRNDFDFGQCYVVITREDRYIKNIYESLRGDDYVTMVSYNMELNPDGRRKFPDRDIAKSEILYLYKVAGKLRRNQL